MTTYFSNRLAAFFCFIAIFPSFISYAQNSSCGCDYTLDAALANGISFSPTRTDGRYLNPKPGQTICLTGNYADLRIEGISGTAANPIIIKNLCDSEATFNSTGANPPLTLANCQYIHLTGAANPAVSYGLSIDCQASAGLLVTGTTVKNIEIDHIEVKKSKFAGFMVKQDPSCDPKTWGDNMTMYNIEIHDNYVHDVVGEGFYIGNSFWQDGMNRPCDGQNIKVYPHRILGLKVHHNTIRNTGWDGLQYGCSPDADVHDNLIENAGVLKVAQQMNGIQIGAGSGGRCYNNTIRNVGGTGVAIIGFVSTTKVYNNLVINASEGIFADSRDSVKLPKIELNIYNNSLINVSQNGITIYDNGYQYKNAANQLVFHPKGYQPRVKNNVIIGAYFDFRLILRDPSITLDSSNNFKLKSPFASPPQYFETQKLALFADTFSYKLKSTSYLVNRGTNSVANVVSMDLLGASRFQDATFDIGAYEYLETVKIPTASKPRITSKNVKSYSLYPSVTIDNVTLDFSNLEKPTKATIYNLMGQPFSQRSIGQDEMSLSLPVNDLPQGYYICVLTSDNKVLSSLRFTKQ
jgi:hypothetical protein